MPPIPEKIIGHDRQCGQLLLDIAKDNIAHAYLLTGPKHIGKFTVARWFATQILCDAYPVEQRAAARFQMEQLIHPDFLCLDQLWVAEEQENWNEIAKTSNVSQIHRSKDGARTNTIGIEDVRALQQRLMETGDNPHLCCLIRDVERMHHEAANALLKMLEEPPPRVVFILTATSTEALLPTIVSRTRVVSMQPLTEQELLPVVVEASQEDREFILHIAQGAPGRAIRMLGDSEILRCEKQLHSQAKQFWQSRSLKDRMQWALAVLKEEKNIDGLLEHLGATLRECARSEQKPLWLAAYLELLEGLRTNAHRGLLLERFALVVHSQS